MLMSFLRHFKFINRYPDHEQTSTLSDALQYIDMKQVDEEGTGKLYHPTSCMMK